MTQQFIVTGMKCDGCANAVKNKLNEIDGVPAGTGVGGWTIGVAAQTGFDLTLTADFHLRLGVMWRQHFKRISEFSFEDDTGVERVWKPLASDGSEFSTTYSGMVAYLGGVYVF